jgi:hypothetical protein
MMVKETVTILIEQELDKVGIDGKTGRFKIKPIKFHLPPGLLNKYGLEKVKMNQVDELSIKAMLINYNKKK